MSKETYQWLERELPSWVKEGLVSEGSAQALLQRYAGDKASSRSSGTAFSLLGFVLVGLGIISIFAYNWDELGHLERTLLAVLLLVGAQAFAFWVRRYRASDAALREGSGVFWFLMTGASLAIIGQTYHLGGSMLDFLSIWLLLSLGIAWVLPSSGAAFFQMILWTFVWLGSRDEMREVFSSEHSFLSPWMLTLLALSWLGFYALRYRKERNAYATLLLGWALAVCVLAVGSVEMLLATYPEQNVRMLSMLFALFFAIYYLLGKMYFFWGEKSWQRPFERMGKLGALVLVLAHVSFNAGTWLLRFDLEPTRYNSLLGLLLMLLFGVLLILFIRKEQKLPSEILVCAVPIIVLGYNLLHTMPYSAMLFVNASVILGAGWMIYCGIKEVTLGLVNQGMIVIALVIWIHFFNANFDLVAKGMAFIVTGILFLSLNAFLKRRFRGVA